MQGTRTAVRTAFVSTYPPRRCGIATFTHDLALAAGSREIVALHPQEQQQLPYPAEVHHRIRRDEFSDYLRIARSLEDCVDVVSIQYEPSIWGGEDGAYVLDFARALNVPAVVTLHAAPGQPTKNQHAIISELVDSCEATVVMSKSAAQLLTSAYGVAARRADVIPHGVPDLPLVDPANIKPGLELEGRKVLLSFGLLGPGKGYEVAIDAMPAILAAHPTSLYVIVGATHPEVLKRDGESYRASLQARVDKLRLGKQVRLVDRFVGRVELTRWLEAADVFLTPCPNVDQIVSGTLAYALGAGRAIVSTPSRYAAEQLADGRGMLVSPGSAKELAAALNGLLGDDVARAEMGRKAYEFSRGMVWSEVATQYRALFARVAGITPVPVMSPSLVATGNARAG